MGKSIKEPDFFTRTAEEVALDLLGKYICRKGGEEKYLIFETEAYYHYEEFCYGHSKSKAEAQKLACGPLFEEPGTWCVYGGQLLLSVTSDELPDNVLIKRLKDKDGNTLGPDKIAHCLHLYKSKPEHCGCSGQHSACENSPLSIADGEDAAICPPLKRINIKDEKKLRFVIDGK